jgi:biopolymer transport protein ExbB
MLSGFTNRTRAALFLFAALLMAALAAPSPPRAAAQDEDAAAADKQLKADLASESQEEKPAAESEDATAEKKESHSLNLFDLIFIRGGAITYVIGMLLVIVIMFSIERGLALRRVKVIPQSLVAELGKLANEPGGLDPRKAYRICQDHPSAASRIIRAMLLKVGRPHSEVEHAVREANEREASEMYANVRWLTLAASVGPLLGLLGTVWGMIFTFFELGHVPAGSNKAVYLATGIYVALVTTLAGLAVAIPAASLAHFFEGRIQTLFRQIDELLFGLLPQLERYEGKIRVNRQHLSGESEPPRTLDRAPAAPPAEPVGAKAAK